MIDAVSRESQRVVSRSTGGGRHSRLPTMPATPWRPQPRPAPRPSASERWSRWPRRRRRPT
jgi:hypothetical protein